MAEDAVRPRGNGFLIAVVALLVLGGTAVVGLAPIARCPMCPFVTRRLQVLTPSSPAKHGCPECGDRTRVSPYDRWRMLNLINSGGP